MKKKLPLLLVLLLVTTVAIGIAFADDIANQIMPRYSYTSHVAAGLSFSGNVANCSGGVSPSGDYDASVTVTLYRQNGSSWDYVTSWSGSATGGSTAAAGGSVNVGSGSGTYKVTTRGNVGHGLEYPTKSVTRSK